MKEHDQITVFQAYLTMYAFLKEHFKRTPSDALGDILSASSLLQDRDSADAAMIEDWLDVIKEVLKTETPQREDLLTLSQGFAAMYYYMKQYYERGGADEVSNSIMAKLKSAIEDPASNPELYAEWLEAVAAALKDEHIADLRFVGPGDEGYCGPSFFWRNFWVIVIPCILGSGGAAWYFLF